MICDMKRIILVLLVLLMTAHRTEAGIPADTMGVDKPGVRAALLRAMIPSAFELEESKERTPSIGGAFVRSALIPGWGQRSVGARTSARNFFVADVTLLLGVISYHVYGNWLKDDYQLFAAQHAGVDQDGKSDKFFVDVSNYASVDEYNQSRLRRREAQALYDPETYYWRWNSDTNREKFDRMRLRSERAFSRSELIIAAVIANHIISGIHAAWKAHRRSSSETQPQQGEASSPHFGVATSRDEIRLTARVGL